MRHLPLVLAAFLGPLCAQSAIAGRWAGRIEVPPAALEVAVVLREADGVLTGTISIPAHRSRRPQPIRVESSLPRRPEGAAGDVVSGGGPQPRDSHVLAHSPDLRATQRFAGLGTQDAHELPLRDLAVVAGRVRFAIAGVPGAPSFDGALSEDGSRLAGEFRQGATKAPFALARAGEVTPPDALAGFAEFVAAARAAHDVPGLAVAVVKDGKVVFAQGFGVADAATGRPVTEHTLFAIGSSTKAFTALALAVVLAEGRRGWDTPVRALLPEFDLADPVAAAQCTLRDLAAHRSGLPRHDLVWYLGPVDRADLLRRLPHLPLSKPVRDQFQYCNHGYAVLGAVLERLTGKAYDVVLRERLLAPLGMERTRFGAEDLAGAEDVASAHSEKSGRLAVIPRRAIGGMAPAGCLESSAADVARWLLLQTGKGRVEGRQVVDAALLRATHTPVTALPLPESPERGTIPAGYALGWFVESYRGHLRVQHGGAIDGFVAHVGFYPFAGIGVVALANRDGTGLPALIEQSAADRLLGLERTDWVGRAAQRRQAAKAAEAAMQAEPASVHGATQPVHELAAYAGEYEHAGYGVVKVTAGADGLRVAFANLGALLRHVHYETFALAEQDGGPLAKLRLLFVTGVDGDVDALRVALEPAVDAIAFARRGDAALRDPAYLQRFAGRYEGVASVEVAVAGDGLRLSVPGQPVYTLTPTRRNAFVFADVKGFRARFDGDGERAAAIVLEQPNGTFRLPRKE